MKTDAMVAFMAFSTNPFKPVPLFGLATFFVGTGCHHFIKPSYYIDIMSSYLPMHMELVYVSDSFEVLGGLRVFIEFVRGFAGIGLIALLVAVFR